MSNTRAGLDEHLELVPHFATRAEIAELREKVMSLQTIVRALAARLGGASASLEEWALVMAQFNAAPGRALSTAQAAAMSLEGTGSLRTTTGPVPQRPNEAA